MSRANNFTNVQNDNLNAYNIVEYSLNHSVFNANQILNIPIDPDLVSTINIGDFLVYDGVQFVPSNVTPPSNDITSLPDLVSVQNTTIPSISWNYLSNMQNVSITSSVIFEGITANTITASNITGLNLFSATTITDVNNLYSTNISTTTITASNITGLNLLLVPNLSVSTITASTITGVNNLYSTNISTTTITASNITGYNILSIPNLTTGIVTANSCKSPYFGNIDGDGDVVLEAKSNIYFLTSGTVRGIINQYGNWTIDQNDLASTTMKLYVNGKSRFGNSTFGSFDSSNYVISINGAYTTNVDGYAYGLLSNVNFSASTNSIDFRSISSQSSFTANGNTLNNAMGLYISNYLNTNTGNITNAYGLYIDPGSVNTGTVTNAYGLYVNTPNHGTNKYAAYVNGLVYIQGDIASVLTLQRRSDANQRSAMTIGRVSGGASGGWELGQSLGQDTIKDFYIYDGNTAATRAIINTSGGTTIGPSNVAGSVNAKLCVSNLLTDVWGMYINGNSTVGFATCALSFRDTATSRQYSVGIKPTVSTFTINDETAALSRVILNSSGNVTVGQSDLASTNYKMYVDGNLFGQTFYQNDRCIIKMFTGTTIYPANAFTTVIFENYTVIFDPQSWFSPASPNKITVGKAGTYTIKVSLRMKDGFAGSSIGIKVDKNETSLADVAMFYGVDGNGRRSATICDAYKNMAALDRLRIQVFHTSLNQVLDFVYFEVERIA